MPCLILQTQTDDPYRNLAVEEYLLGRVADHPAILFLWQAAAVVIGKNQDPWLECDPALIEQEGGRLARRISGGGTVYHDAGNLNYAFIVPRASYDWSRLFRFVLSVLQPFGVKAEVNRTHAFLVDGRKISGTAFAYRKTAVLHHGTLLVTANLDRLRRWLQPARQDPSTRAIRSIPSSVVNLAELVPTLTVEKMKDAFRQSFLAEFDSTSVLAGDEYPDPAVVEELRKKHASREWRYGETPPS